MLKKIISQIRGILNLRVTSVGSFNTWDFSDSSLYNVRIDITGSGNRIICNSSFLKNVSFKVRGDNNIISIGPGCGFFYRCEIIVEGDSSSIIMGENCTFEDVEIAAVEDRMLIRIGAGCMFSHGVKVRTSDSHGIYDHASGRRLNSPRSVHFGKRVWIGINTIILKGAHISDDSIVGAASLLSKKFDESNVIIAGNPGKVLRRNVVWTRDRPDQLRPSSININTDKE